MGGAEKKIKLPQNIPANPSTVYKRQGTWKSWGDFLSTGTIAPQDKIFISYEIARATNIERNIQSITEWENFKNSSEYPDNYPLAPTMVYKDNWVGWAEYLGKTKIEYYSYVECISIIHPLKIKSQKEFKKWHTNHNKDIKIPLTPESIYDNKGWESWGKFLGTNRISHKIKSGMFLPYDEAEKFSHTLKFTSQLEYMEWAHTNKRPVYIPSSPSIFYKDKGWESWSKWLGIIGNGIHSWTKQSLIAYLKNTEQELNNLDPVELLTIINSNNLARRINQLGYLEKLIASDAHTELRKKILKEVIEKIENSEDIELEEERTDSPLLEGEITEAKKENIIPTELIPFNPIQDLKMLDSKSITVSLDEENIEFLIKYRLNKLWNHVLNLEVDIKELENEPGGSNFPNFELIRKIFFEEYVAITNFTLPDDYNFRDESGKIIEPNLMQKLTQHRLLRDKSYGNWTDTGGGKTLAAILAGRSAKANHTLIICNNATVEGWVKSINEYFINNNIFVKHQLSEEVPNNIYQVFHKYRIQIPDNGNNYVVLNYETFQQDDGEYIVDELLKNNNFDYIILDEVQNVKQRDIENESNRRSVINKLLAQARKNNSKLLTLVMTATPVINNLFEARMLNELLTGVKHKELNTFGNIPNGVEMYKALTRHGLRYIPKYGISVHEEIITIDGSELQDKILSIRKGDIVGFEKILLSIKLDAVRSKIKKGTLIYTHYVTELIPEIRNYVENLGYTAGLYTGMDKDGLRQFKKGQVDVLIGSAPVGTGVDGIQKICNTLIPVCLPWTNSEWRQIKGRIDRQGSHFKDVNIYIPQVVIALDEVNEWSWDKKRFNIIRYKATLADLAVDGRIPDKLLPSKTKMLEDAQKELREWVKRLESGNLITFERSELQIPLNPDLIKKEQRIHGDFSKMNQRWSVSKSKTTFERLQKNQDEWYYYHTLYSEKRKTWSEIPYIEISKKIQFRPEWIVGDFGCGENLLAKEVKNKIHAFDFVAVDDSVTACDISQVPLKDNTLDVAVFSLSLMGNNYKDYLNEAYRVLKPYGNIFVAEPAEKWLGREHELKAILEEVGFKCHKHEKNTGKFIYLDGVKY